MAVRDPKTEHIRINIYKQMTGEQKVRIASQIYESAMANMRSAILDRHPYFTEIEIQREIRRRVLTRDEFLKVEAHLEERRQQDAEMKQS